MSLREVASLHAHLSNEEANIMAHGRRTRSSACHSGRANPVASEIRRMYTNGWSVRNRAFTDSGGQQTFVDKRLVFTRSGLIREWRIYSRNAGIVNLQVWRPQSENTCRMTLISQTTVDVDFMHGDIHIIKLPLDQGIRVTEGDLIGWSNPGLGVITWDTNLSSSDQYHCFKWGLDPVIGQVYDLNDDVTWGPSRVYSIKAGFTDLAEKVNKDDENDKTSTVKSSS